ALLASLPQAPTRLNPLRHFERACKRQQWILERMVQTGLLTREEFERVKTEPLRLASPRRAFAAPHFVDLLLQRPEDWMPNRSQAIVQPGAPRSAIRTTLDLDLNRVTEQCVRQQLARL